GPDLFGGPRQAVPDPGRQVRDRGIGKPALRGHLELFAVADGADDQALLGVRGQRRGAAVPSPEDRLPGIQEQAALALVGLPAVAGVASVGEQRADLLLEEVRIRLQREDGAPDGDHGAVLYTVSQKPGREKTLFQK